jgi:carboxyl-terminal processing protease
MRGKEWLATMLRRSSAVVGLLNLTLWGHLTLAAAPPAPDLTARRAEVDETYELFQMLADAVDQVQRNYVQPISRRALIEAALDGIVRKLDPYSSYIKAADMERFRETVDSNYTGIGVKLSLRGGQLTVRGPLVGGPAYRAGLRAGDQIVAIDHVSTKGMRIDAAVQRIKGRAGTSVQLSIRHVGQTDVEDFPIDREVIQIETVLAMRRKANGNWDFMLDPKRRIAYIRITVFGRATTDELKHALDELKHQKLQGLVLDLRFNPGGLLGAAIRVADLFVAEGRIVSVTGRNTPRREFNAQQAGTFDGFPIAVLVNRFSASASEIVAACLQDHHRAIIVGQRTWGKGSVQNVIQLEGGRSALKLTTSRYLRPNGHDIHRFPDAGEDVPWGVLPDEGMAVDLTDDETAALFLYQRYRDLQLIGRTPTTTTAATSAALAIPGSDDSPEPDHQEFVDRQLDKAISCLKTKAARTNSGSAQE